MKTWEIQKVSNNVPLIMLSLAYALIGVTLLGYTAKLIVSERELMISYMIIVATIGSAILLQGGYTLTQCIKPPKQETVTLTFNEGVFLYKDGFNEKVTFTTADIKKFKISKSKKSVMVKLGLSLEAINLRTKESVKEIIFKLPTDKHDEIEQLLKNM